MPLNIQSGGSYYNTDEVFEVVSLVTGVLSVAKKCLEEGSWTYQADIDHADAWMEVTCKNDDRAENFFHTLQEEFNEGNDVSRLAADIGMHSTRITVTHTLGDAEV